MSNKIFNNPLQKSLEKMNNGYGIILKSNSSYGNYVIHITPTESKYFFKKQDAIKFLSDLN